MYIILYLSIMMTAILHLLQVLVRGRHVFMGYIGVAEKTRDVLDSQGWFKSGDVGYIDKVIIVPQAHVHADSPNPVILLYTHIIC